jgi:hypothetical protein
VTSREVWRRSLAIKALESAHGVARRQRSREQLSLEQGRIRASDLILHFSGSVEVSFLKLPRKFSFVLQQAPEVAGCRLSYRHPDARLFVIST